MNKNRWVSALLTIVVGLGLSCRDFGEEPGPPHETGLIPAAVGNTWVYVDTYVNQGILRTSVDSTVIVSMYRLGGIIWWEPKRVMNNPAATTFLFSLFRNEGGRVLTINTDSYGGIPYESVVFVTPTVIESEYGILTGGDSYLIYRAKLCQDTLFTQSGTFSPYALYYYGPSEPDSIFVVPNVGVVKRIRHGQPFDTWTVTSELVRYKIFR
jgi:hypothetical protein